VNAPANLTPDDRETVSVLIHLADFDAFAQQTEGTLGETIVAATPVSENRIRVTVSRPKRQAEVDVRA
jgi:hypothetical protein